MSATINLQIIDRNEELFRDVLITRLNNCFDVIDFQFNRESAKIMFSFILTTEINVEIINPSNDTIRELSILVDQIVKGLLGNPISEHNGLTHKEIGELMNLHMDLSYRMFEITQSI